MVTKVYGNGDGTGVNDTHVEIPPIILVHNKTPFEDYSAAVSAVEQKTINPGEIIIAYYKNPATADGLSAIIAVGPLTQGGKNDIFKNAEEIDALVEYVSTLISGQQSSFDDLCEQLRQEIASEIEATKQSLIAENTSIIDAAMQYMAVKFDTSFGQFVEIVNNHIDGSINDLQTFVVNHVSTLNREFNELRNETNEEINTIDTHIDSSYNELKVLIGQSSGSSDSSCKAYVDEKIAEQDARFQAKINEMNVSIMNISTMADARIDAIELALDNEIEDRQADLNRQITNLTASLTDYADNVRRDSSAYTKQLDLEQKEYIDNKIYELRTEKNNDIANLSDTMRTYTDGSINRMKNIIDGEIVQAVTGVNTRMDSSLAALKTYTDQKNEELRGELEDAYEAADNALYNRLNNKIDQNADEFDASLAALGAALRSEITNGDASVLVAARAMSNDTSTKAKSDNDELEAELKSDIRDLSTEVRREFNSSIAYIDNKQTEYTDTLIQNVSTSLNQKIDNTKTTIEQHIDSSITVLTQTVNEIISHSDASLNEKIDSLEREVSTLREETTTKIDELDASLTNYINSSVVASVNDLSTRTSQSIETIQNELADGLAAVAMNASTDNKILKEEIESHFDASWVEMNTSVFNLVAIVDEEIREEFNSSIASVLATSRQENAALESEINTHIDASVAEINHKEAQDVQTINAHIDASISELKNHSDSEDAEIRLEFADADASLKAEVEEDIVLAKTNVEEQLTDKFNALDSSLEDAVAQLRTEIAEGDTSVAGYVTRVEVAMTQKFASVEENMATADASVLTAAKDYADVIEGRDVAREQALRTDVSAIQADIALKFDEDETQHALDVSLLNSKIETLGTGVESEISRIENVIEHMEVSTGGDIEAERLARIAKDEEIDASIENIKRNVAELSDYVDASLNSLRTELQEFAEEKDAEQYNLISGIVVQMFEDFDASVSGNFNDVYKHIEELHTDIDSSVVKTIEDIEDHIDASVEEIYDTIIQMHTDLDTSIVRTIEDVEDHIDASVNDIYKHIEELHTDIDTSVVKTIEDIEDHIDASVNDIYKHIEELHTDIDTSVVKTIEDIEDHIDASVAEIYDTIIEMHTDLDTSIVKTIEDVEEHIDASVAEIYETIIEMHTDLDTSIVRTIEDVEDHIDASVAEIYDTIIQMHTDLDTSIVRTIEDVEDHIDASVADIYNYIEELHTDIDSSIMLSIEDLQEQMEQADASISNKLDAHIRYTGYKFDDNEIEHTAFGNDIYNLEVSLNALRRDFNDYVIDVSSNFDVVTESINENANDIYSLNQKTDDIANDVSAFEEQYSNDKEIIIDAISAIEDNYVVGITKEPNDEYFETYVFVTRSADEYTDVSLVVPTAHFYQMLREEEAATAAAFANIDNRLNKTNKNIEDIENKIIELHTDLDTSVIRTINDIEDHIDASIAEINEKQALDTSVTDSKFDVMFNYIVEQDDALGEKIDSVDSSVKQLFDMVYAIYNKLGLDNVIEPSTNVLPAIIEEIKKISDEDLDWRTLGNEPEPDPDYDDEWRELDDGGEEEQNDNVLHSTMTRTVASGGNEAYEETWREIH